MVERDRRKRSVAPTSQGAGFPETGFNPHDSQAQVPSALAEQGIASNVTQATNALDAGRQQGLDVTGTEFADLQSQADTGFREKALGGLLSAVGWIDGPRQFINLFMQDIAGGAAGVDQRNPNVGDYWDALWGGIEDTDGFELATGLNPLSGSDTLDMFGWDLAEEDDGWGRFWRGAADFGLQVFTDPLTYVTFGLGGVAKKVAVQAARSLQLNTIKSVVSASKHSVSFGAAAGKEFLTTGYEKLLFANKDKLVKKWTEKMAKRKADNGGVLPEHIADAMQKQVGSSDLAKMDPDKVLELAIADEIFDDLIQPLTQRNFARIPQELMDDLPGYMKGGARIAVPFIGGGKVIEGVKGTGKGIKSGLLIPGTRGLGRTIIGDPIRAMSAKAKAIGVPGYEPLLNTLEKAAVNLNRSGPMIRAMRASGEAGGIEGWQFHILESAKENLINRNAKHTISTNVAAQWREIDELAKDAGISLDDIGPDVWMRMEGQNVADTQLRQMQGLAELDPDDLTGLSGGLQKVYDNDDLDNAVHGLVTYMQETMGEYHAALGMLDPFFKEKFIKGYIPHQTTKKGGKFLRALANSNASIPTGNGNAAEDLASQMLAGIGAGGVAEIAMGATRAIGRRLGLVEALTLTDDGVVMLNLAGLQLMNKTKLVQGIATETRYIPTPNLNSEIVPILERTAKEFNVPIPKDWDRILYNENPVEVMVNYIDNMSEAIEVWQHMDGLARAGLTARHSVEIDAQGTLRKMQEKVVPTMNNMPTSKWGYPVKGNRETMPIRWLEDSVDTKSAQKAIDDLVDPELAGKYDPVRRSIRDEGFSSDSPVLVGVKPDGQMGVMDGHHRIQIASEEGLKDLPVQYIPVEADEPFSGLRRLHDMKEGWHESATKAYNANIAARGAARGVNPPPRKQWDAFDVMNQTSWEGGAVPPNLLGRGSQAVPGVPTPVHTNLTDNGLVIRNLEDVEDAHELARNVAGGNVSDLVEATPVPRVNHFARVDTVPNAKKVGWSPNGPEHYLGNGKKVLAVATIDERQVRLSIAPGLAEGDRLLARNQIIDLLEEQFTNGVLKGKFSARGLRTIAADGLDSSSADLLHEYTRRKMGSLSSETQEFIAREPAELFQSRMLAEDYTKKYMEVIQSHAAVMDSDGHLIRGGKDATITADELMRQRLAHLEDAAKMPELAGYEAISKVMNDVVEYHAVRDIPGMVPPGLFNLQGPAIDGLQIQKDMAQHLSLLARNHAILSTPQGIMAVKTASRQTLKWWKGMATIPRPTFHIRNLMGGTYQNLASGVSPASMLAVRNNTLKFRNALRTAKGPNALEQAFKSVDSKMEASFRAAWDEGVLNGFATTEFSSALTARGKKSILSYANVFDIDDFALTRAGARVMESTEDFMRMSMFHHYYDDAVPGSAKTVREMVNGTHFDYSDLTPFETRIKSYVPFYVWSRRNLPLQLRQAIENPALLQRYKAMMRSMNDNFGGDDEENLEEADHFSAYAAGTDIKVNGDTPFWARMMIDPDLPITDLLEASASPVGFVTNLLGPHLTTLPDLNSQREYGGINAPAPLAQVLKGLAAIGFYDETTSGDVRIPYWMRTLVETAFPFTREIADLIGGPTDPNRQARLGITPDDSFGERSAKSVAGTLLGGVGIKSTTPADTRARAYGDSIESRQDIKEKKLKGRL